MVIRIRQGEEPVRVGENPPVAATTPTQVDDGAYRTRVTIEDLLIQFTDRSSDREAGDLTPADIAILEELALNKITVIRNGQRGKVVDEPGRGIFFKADSSGTRLKIKSLRELEVDYEAALQATYDEIVGENKGNVALEEAEYPQDQD